MADDLITICQNVADQVGLDQPTAIIGATDETSRKLRIAAKREIEALARRPDSHWTHLERTFEFNPALTGTTTGTTANRLEDSGVNFFTQTVSVNDVVKNTDSSSTANVTQVTANYLVLDSDIFTTGGGGDNYSVYRQAAALPSDFHHWIDTTGWNKDTYWSLRGPLTAMEWRFYKHSVLGNSTTLRNRWRIRPYLDVNGDFQERCLFLDPEPTASEDFIMEYVSNALVQKSDGTVQSGWLQDTDTPVLDQYLIELGMAWRTLKMLGLPYAEELDEYEIQVEAAIGRDGGGRVLDLSRAPKNAFLNTSNVPDTGIGQT